MLYEEESWFAEHPNPWYWLSFIDPTREIGKRFLGVAVVQTHGRNHKEALQNAIQEAWKLKINPGGQVKGMPVPIENIPEDCRNRLLDAEEIETRNLGEQG